jgi:RimJ/RimL family protein N-acetyltransferase
MHAPIIYSDRIYLKALSIKHLSQDYVGWLNNATVNQYLETGGDYNIEKLAEYLNSVEQNPILFWAIHLSKDDKHIGNIKIDPVNLRHGVGEYGILLGDTKEWGKGYAREATERVLEYCFGPNLNLRKVVLGVVAKNTSAVNLYKKMGFETEGLYVKHGLYGSEYCDTVRMAIFNPNMNDL